jgi:hypothetical protein
MLSLSICHQVNYEWVELPARKCGLCISETQADVHLLIHITGAARYIFSVTTNGENPTFDATSVAKCSQHIALYSCVLGIHYSGNCKSLFSLYISTVTHTHTHAHIYIYVYMYVLYEGCPESIQPF